MLQIIILHEGRNQKIYEAKDHTTLTTFDSNKGFIDLEPIKDYVGANVIIAHYNKQGDIVTLDYEQQKLLTKVSKDPNGMWFIEYK